MSVAYYNENNREAAEWLRELIKAGEIAPGDVDERSIEQVKPHELIKYRQCHFFAGIGGWSKALRIAGRRDSERIDTGSCPCQPFSVAGKGGGSSDERHLWPKWLDIIKLRNPPIIFGEQVASAAALSWLDGVFSGLENAGYACGAADLCAPGVGAPHLRQRLYWFAVRVEYAESYGREQRGTESSGRSVIGGRATCGMDDSNGARRNRAESNTESETRDEVRVRLSSSGCGESAWANYDAIPCTDGKARRIESGSFPLAYGVSGRVGLLRGYGNAIVPQLAAEFIQAAIETIE